jgi:hypothetical protein
MQCTAKRCKSNLEVIFKWLRKTENSSWQRNASHCSELHMSQTGGLGVGSSNLPAPTNKINHLDDIECGEIFLWGSHGVPARPAFGRTSSALLLHKLIIDRWSEPLTSGARGREFESPRSDQLNQSLTDLMRTSEGRLEGRSPYFPTFDRSRFPVAVAALCWKSG